MANALCSNSQRRKRPSDSGQQLVSNGQIFYPNRDITRFIAFWVDRWIGLRVICHRIFTGEAHELVWRSIPVIFLCLHLSQCARCL